MKAFICSMYNEIDTVRRSLENIRAVHKDAYIILVMSDPGGGNALLQKMTFNDSYILPNLGPKYSSWELPSRCIARNFSRGFSALYGHEKAKWLTAEYIVALTGDTLILDATNFDRIWAKMQDRKALIACSQAFGQDFHADDADPARGICGGRHQTEATADFMPQLWMLNGPFAFGHKAFADIKVTNRYASEQCLGDEWTRHLLNFRPSTMLLNEQNRAYAYHYNDGVMQQHGQKIVGRDK